MRKIEREMIQAIIDQRSWSKANTRVDYDKDSGLSQVFLHGHNIAEYGHKDMGRITSIHVMSKSVFQHMQSKKILNDTMVPLRKFQGVATELQLAPCVVLNLRGDENVSPSDVMFVPTNFEDLKMEAAVASNSHRSNTAVTASEHEREVERLKRKLEEKEAELSRWKSASGKLIAATTKRKRR